MSCYTEIKLKINDVSLNKEEITSFKNIINSYNKKNTISDNKLEFNIEKNYGFHDLMSILKEIEKYTLIKNEVISIGTLYSEELMYCYRDIYLLLDENDMYRFNGPIKDSIFRITNTSNITKTITKNEILVECNYDQLFDLF